MKKILLLFIVLIACVEAQSQCMLVLDKLAKGSRTRIQTGDYIKIQSKPDSLGNQIRLEGQIMVDCSGIIIFPQGDRIEAKDIAKISIPRRGLWAALEQATFFGGKLYFGISAFNGLVNNDSPIVHRSALPVLLTSEVLHYAIKAHRNHWVKLSPGKKEVKVLDLRP